MSSNGRIPRFARRKKQPTSLVMRLGENTDEEAFTSDYAQAVSRGARVAELAEICRRHGVTIVARTKSSAVN
ncbi:MAG: hypothetical protein M0R28_18115 [Pigmentiphaga sp.]|nr:hypothetical protein [Pigmentiphaga sp.]